MKKAFVRSISAALIVVLLSGCTSVQMLADGPADSSRLATKADGLRSGMSLVISLKNGRKQNMMLTQIEPTVLVGQVNGSEVKVNIDQISRIDERQPDATKTIGLTLAVAAGVAILVGMVQSAVDDVYANGGR